MSAGRVRPLQAGDLAEVVRIERETFADPWSKGAFTDSMRQEYVRALAIEDGDGVVAGYALATIVADEGEILNLAVDRRYRGKGLGRVLLGALLEALREGGVQKAFLEVRRSNQPAIALYRATGFTPLGVRPAYYAIPTEDALTMALELGSQTAMK